MTKRRTRAARRAARPTLYGNPKKAAVTELHDELTDYGALKYRKPVREGEFVGRQGTKPQAVVLDIDGTLTEWGSTANKTTLDWAKKHHDAGRVLIVITARTHEHDYQRSFDWLVAHVPYPFIGPIHRAVDDPRYASEFKKDTIEVLAQLYDIRGAADDNVHVLGMYKNHFGDDFDLLECSYGDYAEWRKDLKSARVSTWTPSGSTVGKTWVSGSWDVDNKTWVSGHYVEDDVPGDDEFADLDEQQLRITQRLDLEEAVWAEYPDLTWDEIEVMDVETLRQLIAEAPLDVKEA